MAAPPHTPRQRPLRSSAEPVRARRPRSLLALPAPLLALGLLRLLVALWRGRLDDHRAPQQVPDRLARLCANLQPLLYRRRVQVGLLAQRVVVAQPLPGGRGTRGRGLALDYGRAKVAALGA